MRAKPVTSVVAVARLELVRSGCRRRGARSPRGRRTACADRRARCRRARPDRRRAPPAPSRSKAARGDARRASRRSSRAMLQRMRVVVGEVVGDAGDARVHVAAAELLGGDFLAGRRLHQRRPAEEDRAGAAHDDRLVAHRRHVGAAGRARAHHHRDLRDAPAPTGAPGCRRCGRSARDRGRPRPAAAGTRRPSRPGRRRAGGSPARSPARAGASSR